MNLTFTAATALLTFTASLCGHPDAHAQEAASPPPQIMPFSHTSGAKPNPPWRVVGLPRGKKPMTQMDVTTLDGAQVLRVQTDHSYGTLVHEVPPWVPTPQATLKWHWRLDTPLENADIHQKSGDDAALKVCVMFDMPIDAVPFMERSLLRFARTQTTELLPTATLCYLWDTTMPAGTALPNAFTRRVRYVIVDGADSPLAQWRTHQRHLHADFLQAFGDEATEVPPVLAVVLGADADNTGGRSLGYVGDLRVVP